MVAVDPDGAGAQTVSDAHGKCLVARPDTAGQPIYGVIGLGYQSVIDIVKWRCHQYWTKYLFLDDFHVRIGVNQDGRLDKIAFVLPPPFTAANRACSFLSAGI